MGDVAVALANWNGLEFVPRCLQALVAQSHPPSQIVVVDNGSTDGSREWIRSNHPQVELIENEENEGFAAGYNRAIASCRSRFILILNTDVFLGRDFIAETLSTLERSSDIGATTGLIYQEATRQELNGGFFMRRLLRIRPSSNVREDEEVFGCTGAALLCRGEMLDSVRLEGEVFDESFFAYCEDIDLAWRAQLNGWKACFNPLARAHHVGSGSLGGRLRFVSKPVLFQRHVIKNRYLTLIKNASRSTVALLLPALVLADLALWMYLIARSPSRIALLLRAYLDVFRLLPEALRKRRAIQGRRAVEERDIKRFFNGWI
jgi:GT2 family glycosyltransferase